MMPHGTIYLSGARTPVLDARVRAAMNLADTYREVPPIGLLVTPLTKQATITNEVANIYPYVGLDNGCFTESGRAKFAAMGLSGYIELGQRVMDLWGDQFLFATAPDVPFDWAGTLRASMPVIAELRRALPARAALVLQDGATPANIPWNELDWIFIGGSTEWKIGPEAKACAAEANRRRKGVHMGRVNSLERMRIAHSFACDSADGTYLVHEVQKGNGKAAVDTMWSWVQDTWSSGIRQTPDRDRPETWGRSKANPAPAPQRAPSRASSKGRSVGRLRGPKDFIGTRVP